MCMRKEIGAVIKEDQSCNFIVWAPFADKIKLLLKDRGEPIALSREEKGYWKVRLENVDPETQYKYRIGEKDLPDPASRYQPEGVHSWSQVVTTQFSWEDDSWKGLGSAEMIIYELHVGTFTSEGTFEAIIGKLQYLKELGINTIEIMPVAQFPGNRNWGYDGVYPFAVQNSYGGPDGLKRLVNACHKEGIAVVLDVVYNHLGPEGNYMSEFGPYFTDKYKTPWGSAINYDDEHSDEVRSYFHENALRWLEEFHLDGLRLDAVHEIIDRGAFHFLEELSAKVDELERSTGRHYVLIAETDLNDKRFVSDREKGGYGLEAQWVDDFHHSVHTLLTKEEASYYSDYGEFQHLEKTLTQGYVYDGVYSPFRKKRVGNNPQQIPPECFVVSIQNHDQIGNRLQGERLSTLISTEGLKLAASLMLTSRYVPMLFMGEEFAEDRPFRYFISHTDPELVKAVQEGRRREFSYFFKEHADDFPDPQGEEIFEGSKLNWDFESETSKKAVFEYYKELIRLRKMGAFSVFRNSSYKVAVDEESQRVSVSASGDGMELLGIFSFSNKLEKFQLPEGRKWHLVISSSEDRWGGTEEVTEEAFEAAITIQPYSAIILSTKPIEKK